MNLLMALAVCALRGHDDINRTPEVTRGAPLMECQRCGRIGWLLPPEEDR